MDSYYKETIAMIKNRKKMIAEAFEKECLRLLNSGAIDKESHSRGALFGIALENLANGYDTSTREARNLRKF